MKAALVLDQFADVSALTPEQAKLIVWKTIYKKPEAVFPAGTVFEGDDALRMCGTGQAMPIDDECAQACGLSAAQLASLQVGYKMDTLGINRKEDRELYRAGVILGYDKDLKYIHGPNWDAYQAAKLDSAMSEDDI